MKADEFSERIWEFAANVALFVETLPDTRVGRHAVGQLLRAGTSSAPNYDEADQLLGMLAKSARTARAQAESTLGGAPFEDSARPQ